MSEPTFYLFDGFNLLHAGGFEDSRELTDKLASFVAEKGARGVLVFDGTGEDLELRAARGSLRRARRHAARAAGRRASRARSRSASSRRTPRFAARPARR